MSATQQPLPRPPLPPPQRQIEHPPHYLYGLSPKAPASQSAPELNPHPQNPSKDPHT